MYVEIPEWVLAYIYIYNESTTQINPVYIYVKRTLFQSQNGYKLACSSSVLIPPFWGDDSVESAPIYTQTKKKKCNKWNKVK